MDKKLEAYRRQQKRNEIITKIKNTIYKMIPFSNHNERQQEHTIIEEVSCSSVHPCSNS
jgi:predicted DNA-binding protein YlxM (UPF0122 family)